MQLRPHHLLCIQKYTGHGYDAAFTAHMNTVVSELVSRPQTPIDLTEGCDDLCHYCPNRVGNACSSPEKVDGMDRAVLEVCRLAYGQTLPWSTLAQRARTEILNIPKFDAICQSCQWYSLCKETEVPHEFNK